MKYSNLEITYANPLDLTDTITLKYQLRGTPLVERWTDILAGAIQNYTVDDPARFYGFDLYEDAVKNSITHINKCVDIINSHANIVTRKLTDVKDQDTLNYLHNIFEKYHGLLDTQDNPIWNSASAEVRKALADLNLAVHRCESVATGNRPRHVVTYYGLPKSNLLKDEDYLLYDQNIKFGTVYLNYVEIGKTFEDYANDNDQYIADEAFQQPKHISADFSVQFWNATPVQIEQHCVKLKAYYDTYKEFFVSRDLLWDSPKLAIGRIPLADLVEQENVVQQLTTKQWITSVILT